MYDMKERNAAASRGSVGVRGQTTPTTTSGNDTVFLGIPADHVDVSEQHQTWSTLQSCAHTIRQREERDGGVREGDCKVSLR